MVAGCETHHLHIETLAMGFAALNPSCSATGRKRVEEVDEIRLPL
jgi:hypothetical protein